LELITEKIKTIYAPDLKQLKKDMKAIKASTVEGESTKSLKHVSDIVIK